MLLCAVMFFNIPEGTQCITVPDWSSESKKDSWKVWNINPKILTSVNIPSSVIIISNYAFFECVMLTSISIPNSVVSIGEYCFVGCMSFKHMSIPSSVTFIGDRAFFNCNNLEIVEFPESVIGIGTDLFKDCDKFNMLLIQPLEDDNTDSLSTNDYIHTPAVINAFNEQTGFRNVTKIWASDSIIMNLNYQYAKYDTFRDIPFEMRAAPNAKTWAGVQLWLKWSNPESDAFEGREVSPSRQQMVWTLMHVAHRLETTLTLSDFADVLPLEMWMLIMTFVEH